MVLHNYIVSIEVWRYSLTIIMSRHKAAMWLIAPGVCMVVD